MFFYSRFGNRETQQEYRIAKIDRNKEQKKKSKDQRAKSKDQRKRQKFEVFQQEECFFIRDLEIARLNKNTGLQK